ncbi:hypothetical protein EOI86_23930 [Hwanghaeella grinnelliae]|uniref:Uncharacterized protein n=1 Tax=Hwanghaeella grinnelliae TaxID=2500179 RepID=A0A437QHX2_9PROT|nr:hypothetical protein [Hwanghaeella grinnelliae]RVU34163.1 hypothetical protein EOI86_23930 [Hwanghaeella grinnelliae]
MPKPIPNDGAETSYWLQALQAGHWRNLEQIADAGDAMTRTGTAAQDTVYDAVRLLEARFHPQKGRTEFFEVVTVDIAGAHFAGLQGNSHPDHIRMDLSGTIAPLLPSATKNAADDTTVEADREDVAAVSAPHGDTRFDGLRHDLIPRQQKATPSRASQSELRQDMLRRRSMRSRLMAGVMVGAFAAGVAVSAMAPDQSEKLAAALFERIGVEAVMRATQLAQAPEPAGIASTARQSQEDPVAWPVAWGPQTGIAPAPARMADPVKAYAVAAAPSGLDLEAEHRQPAANMLAASLAAIAAPTGPVQQHIANGPEAASTAPPAAMTAEQAYALQASLPVPLDHDQAPVTPSAGKAVQIAATVDDGLQLLPQGPQNAVSQGTFTTAVAGDASQLETAAAFPRPLRKPAAIKERAAYRAALADAIERGTVEDLLTLIDRPDEVVEVASLSDSAIAPVRRDLTPLLDFALLQGRPDHAAALAAEGASPSAEILTLLTQSADQASLKRIVPILRKVGIDPNRVSDTGMTPLMQAAYIGDGQGVEALLTLGADPAFETGDGLRAADFAARAKHVDMQEKLVLAADQAMYSPLMFGLSWSDTVETVKARSKVCKQVGEGFIACSLKAESWLDDTAAIIAQFDTRNGNRLVAIQVDSRLYSDADDAEVGFKKAAGLIAKVVPPDQFGFPVRDIPSDMPVFESLTPAIGTGQYFQYWPDDNLKRPVYVHMKMIGYKRDRGFHRIVIGNPFRVG